MNGVAFVFENDVRAKKKDKRKSVCIVRNRLDRRVSGCIPYIGWKNDMTWPRAAWIEG